MSFSFSHFQWSSAVISGALAVAGCRTPGEGFEDASTGNANATAATGSSPTNTQNVTTSSDMGSTNGGVTNNVVTVTSAGDPTSDTSATNDATVTSDTSSTSDGAGGGANATTDDTTGADDTSSTSGGTPGSNIINNGDFQSDSASCVIDDSDWFTEGTLNWAGVDDTVCAYCIVLEADQTGQLNWSGNSGTPPTLESGQSYTFSFDVYSDEGTAPTLRAKVGQPVDPYAAFVEEDVSVPSSSATQTFTFNMGSSDQAGIAFFVSAGAEWGKICIDNVVLQPQ